MKTSFFAAGFLLALSAAPIGAQPIDAPAAPPRKTMIAVRMDATETIALDGRLDEGVWKRAMPAAEFMQQDPDNGQPATEPTEVRIVYDGHALYMGVTCFDSEPTQWLGYQRRRDEFLQADDRFMWNIDTYNNQQSSYFFEMNPSGLMGDALRTATTQNRQWDGIWNAKVHHSEIGWTIEIEIPFRTLNFDPSADEWGINFQRTVRRKNEESVWTGWARNQGLNRMSNAGLLTGLRGVSQGRGLDLKPYVLATSESFPGRAGVGTKNKANAGLDLFYSPTPRVRTNLTVNTDFAQTEVDQRLVNLTRFPAFFPEKRDFFLDGSTFFDFLSNVPSNNNLIPYFSRRIGLDANGNPQRINVGAKLTGQFGMNDVGAIYVRTGEEDDALGENFAVMRARRRMFRQSYVGMLYTGRQSSLASSQTFGADALFATSEFRGSDNLSAGGFFLKTSNPGVSGKSAAFGGIIDYPNDPWSTNVYYREIQENYKAEVGFTPRRGIRHLGPEVYYTYRPERSRWLRTIQYGIDSNVILSTRDNRLLNRDVDFQIFNVNLHSQDSFQLHVIPTYEWLDGNFPIDRRVTLPGQTGYAFTRYRVNLAMAQRRKVAFSPTFEGGSFYNGTRKKIALELNLRLRPGVIIYTAGEWNDVQLKEGRFETHLIRVVPELQFSPWVAWVNNVQYDTQSSVVGWQSRFRWILRPGNDFYLVYTHNWLDDPLERRTYTLDRRMASKFLYTYGF